MKQAKLIVGKVLANKMDKTIVVAVEHRFNHPHYHKVVKRTTKLYAHDENNTAKPGETVALVASRPLSRMKRWRVVKIIQRGQTRPTPAEEGESA